MPLPKISALLSIALIGIINTQNAIGYTSSSSVLYRPADLVKPGNNSACGNYSLILNGNNSTYWNNSMHGNYSMPLNNSTAGNYSLIPNGNYSTYGNYSMHGNNSMPWNNSTAGNYSLIPNGNYSTYWNNSMQVNDSIPGNYSHISVDLSSNEGNDSEEIDEQDIVD